MSKFKTKVILYGDTDLIPSIAAAICKGLKDKGYDGYRRHLSGGRIDVFISKGSFLTSFLGMDTGLHIRLEPVDDGISFMTRKDINCKRWLPSVCLMFLLWPFLPTLLWGFWKQSQLRSKALSIAEAVISRDCVDTQYFPTPPCIRDAYVSESNSSCSLRLSQGESGLLSPQKRK